MTQPMNGEGQIVNEMQAQTVHEARNAWFTARPIISWIVSTALLCMLLALLGAVNSYGVPFAARMVFWSALFAVAFVFALGIEAALLRARTDALKPWQWLLLFSGILAVAMTPVAYVANSLGGWAPFSMLLQHFANSLVISLAFVGLRMGLGLMLQPEASQSIALPSQAKLLERLPPAYASAQLFALEADGHYVRVHTDRGTEMVLIRLKDAIGETGGAEGIQVHRSWWIARDAIIGSKSRDGALSLELVGDLDVPVSRNRRHQLRETGWLR